MHRRPLVGLALVCALGPVSDAAAREPAPDPDPTPIALTLDAALALARERAAPLRIARAAIPAAHAERVGASVPLASNPRLEVGGGPRFHDPAAPGLDLEVGLSQAFELGGQRGARLARADASVAEVEARVDLDAYALAGAVATAWVVALRGEAQVAVAADALRVDEAIRDVANRRQAVGDAGSVEATLAELAVARARVHLDAVRAAAAAAADALAVLIGLPPGSVAVAGDLEGALVDRVAGRGDRPRPDVAALSAALVRIERDVALAESERWPDLHLRVGYAREESADIAVVGLAIDLPVFDDGAGAVAVARARREALETQRAAVRERAALAVAAARADLARREAAARAFDASVAATLAEAERLARRAYEAGALPLGELLAVRRELGLARADRVALFAALAEARVRLAHATGALQ